MYVSDMSLFNLQLGDDFPTPLEGLYTCLVNKQEVMLTFRKQLKEVKFKKQSITGEVRMTKPLVTFILNSQWDQCV